MICDLRFAIWLKRAGFTVVLLSTLNPQFSTAFAQGSLTPPGAPAPTMKSLDQIEARRLISSAPFTITQSGSYYLVSNISVTAGSAITISASQVTLDLNGFTISSTEASPAGTGILIGGGLTDVTILNGHIKGNVTSSGGIFSGNGFANGIFYSSTPPLNVRVAGVSVSGCLADGIHLGTINSSLVESCTVLTVGGFGIEASSVLRSTAKGCGNDGISADTAADSSGNCTGSGYGVDATFSAKNCNGSSTGSVGLNSASADNCYGSSLNGEGLNATVANNCYGFSVVGIGLDVTTATGCYGYSSSAIGLFAQNALNCYGESSSSDGMSVANPVGCYGLSDGNGNGIQAVNAQNCYGASAGNGNGISTGSAFSCYGSSGGSGYGITAAALANNCIGSSTNTALRAFILNSSFGSSLSYTYKYNMP